MSRRRTPTSTLRTRGDWRGLVILALACAADAEGPEDNVIPNFGAANLRRMDLARRCAIAQTDQLEREGGAVTGDLARVLVRIGRAWSRPETSGETRASLTPLLRAAAEWMDGRLHGMATNDFQRAHAGRPEVA